MEVTKKDLGDMENEYVLGLYILFTTTGFREGTYRYYSLFIITSEIKEHSSISSALGGGWWACLMKWLMMQMHLGGWGS